MPDCTPTSISPGRQAAASSTEPGFDPAMWLVSADAAGVRVQIALEGDEATAIFFGDLLERRDGLGGERAALVAAYILSNEPDRVCVVRGES